VLNGLKHWEKPKIINTDKAPTYGIAPRTSAGEERIVERAFGIGASAITEGVDLARKMLRQGPAKRLRGSGPLCRRNGLCLFSDGGDFKVFDL
jgi:hypothetical protein